MSLSEPAGCAQAPAAVTAVPMTAVPMTAVTAPALPSRRALRAARTAEPAATAAAVLASAPGRSRAARRTPRPATQRRSPLTIGVAFLAIPGLLLTLALPAYAYAPGASGAPDVALGEAQGLAVSAASVSISLDRDGYTATTPEDIAAQIEAARQTADRERSAEAARASSAQYASSGIRVENDDYPWPDGAVDGTTLSPQGYYFKECVDFVAWRLNRDAGATATDLRWTWQNLTPGAGSARSWSSAWSGQGRVTSDTPVVGAVAWFTYNHVAYVQSIPGDGTVVLEEYNWMGSHAYHTRVVPIEDVALYLYPPS